MPELPDIVVYIDALERRISGRTLLRVRLGAPFLLRTVAPPLQTAFGKRVERLRRVGKRIAIGLEGDLWLVLHLMIAGRLHWRAPGAKVGGRQTLAAFDFGDGAMVLTEAGSRHRASLHVVAGNDELAALDPGGLEVFDVGPDAFANALTSGNHTLKRALTNPRLFSGIGNAYSDEILHRAQLSPIALTQNLKPGEIQQLYSATREVLLEWVERLRREAGNGFPEKVTAFRDGMAAHGRFGLPCPRCGAKIQRIRYADNETNYCARCQTGGKRLADRALSRLLGADWPRDIGDA